MKKLLLLAMMATAIAACTKSSAPEQKENNGESGENKEEQLNYKIENGVISEEVLNNYLDRAITESEYLNSKNYNCDGFFGTDDDRRMLLNIGAKFVGRAMYSWGGEQKFNEENWFIIAKNKIDYIHTKDPDVIFQGALFECVSTQVNQVPIPGWVFEAFALPVETRNFDFDKIKCPGGDYVGQWGEGTCVPDMSQAETQMWFYFMAAKMIDCGIEAFHCGQVNFMAGMGDAAAGYPGYRKLFSLIRSYAKTHARRGIVLLDAHCEGIVTEGGHLFDFVSYPIRLKEKAGSVKMEATIQKGYLDSIIGKTKAGRTPSGWTTERIPYLVEFDNFGTSTHPGQAADDIFCWGYDEISWIGNLVHDDAEKFLAYGYDWFKDNDAMGHLEMPGLRVAAGFDTSMNDEACSPFRCNNKSGSYNTGNGLEATIKNLWEN